MVKKIFLYTILTAIGIITFIGGLFIFNGLVLADNEKPVSGITSHPPTFENMNSKEIRIMSYNIAKGFIHKGGIKFIDKKTAEKRFNDIAEVIIKENPDIVFLSEAVFECTPCPVNQIIFLAEKAGMHSWAFGENYNFGLPFYRIVGGNAVLSKLPIRTVANPSLSGRKPFYITTNNRRVLWCSLNIRGQDILAASVHNDSYNRANNLTQTKQLIDFKGNRAAVMAGDFNANPGEPSIEFIRNTGELKASFDGPPTFPSSRAKQKIDFIFVPQEWELISHKVIRTKLSDHYPILSVFRLGA
ncbi:Endonuclease/exonuclease/phosphatase [Desulfonema limicola]|uniref:Endonuclease/exonuclease/phosphatase n=1 Tax=Desulfonema limicola TaxID=45656 RepID=A0A975BB28_9BACT|nr:endonuclease/exonuclease/phosphatase family protein [Desulfonema limicola]QTA82068.1 Endonuclease/exonuclease/phosphatase [Desulfonema limicola]